MYQKSVTDPIFIHFWWLCVKDTAQNYWKSKSLFHFKGSPHIKKIYAYRCYKHIICYSHMICYIMSEILYVEKVKVVFAICEKELSYFLKQNSLMLLVQFTHTGNFETLEAENFQACFFNSFSFFFHLPNLTFIWGFEAVFPWKTDWKFFKTISRSIPVNFRFAYLLIYKMKVLTEAVSWFILCNARLLTQTPWMLEERKPCPVLQKLQLTSSQQGELRILLFNNSLL